MQLDIDKLFQDHHRKLDEVPPRRSWDKLQMRLEHRRTRSRIKRIQSIAVAAAVFAMISFGIVSMLYIQNRQEHSARMSAHAYSDQLQQLEINPASDNGIYSVENVKTMHRLLGQHSSSLN